MNVFVEIVGWAGAGLILTAYLLLSMGKLTGRSLAYQAMNVVGAIGFIINGWWHGAIPSVGLNAVWFLIGIVTIAKIVRKSEK